MVITSINNSKIKNVVKLKQKKYRNIKNLFLIEGYHLIEEAKHLGVLKEIYTSNHDYIGENVNYVTSEVIKKISDTVNPQGIVGVCEKIDKHELSSKILLLDNIQDPGNLGTLIRSSVAFGFNTVILDNCVDLYNPKVIRSTQGNIFKLNYIFTDIVEFITNNKEYLYYGTSLSGNNLDNFKVSGKTGIILGNEGNGINEEILKLTTDNILIEMNNCESLNVSIAGSIIMYKFRK